MGYQRDYTDCTELFFAHRKHGINERKGENGKRTTGLDDSIAHHL